MFIGSRRDMHNATGVSSQLVNLDEAGDTRRAHHDIIMVCPITCTSLMSLVLKSHRKSF